MTPTRFAAETQKIAKQVRLKFHALGVPEMKKLGMNLLLSVAAGSDQPPKFVILDHHGSKRKGTDIVLIGKGITFDSGGISIKPSEGMEKMKYDMAGAAAVVGTMKAAAEMRLPLNLVGLIPVTENMPSGKASRPGDIVTGMNGKSVEIINTDAEGRLVLADALTYAEKYQPKAVIDLATLTGACVVALGEHAIGMMGNHQKVMDVLKHSGEVAHERVWQLPLWDDYFEQIKSDHADIKNTGGRWGGAITAALFLKQFAEKFHWAHLDIAGTAWIEKDRPYCPKGATGTGVRLMVQFLQDYLDKTI
jgi:leucyl aminopeptidase